MANQHYDYYEVRPLGGAKQSRRRRVSVLPATYPHPGDSEDSNGPGHYAWGRARPLDPCTDAPADGSLDQVTFFRVARRYGILPPRTELRSSNEVEWPEGLDSLAFQSRIHHYQRLIGRSEIVDHFRRTQHAVSFVAAVDQAWYQPPDGIIEGDGVPISPDYVHSFAVLHHERDPHHGLDEFTFVNSWGGDWGHNGYGMLRGSAFDKYVLSSWHCEQRFSLPPHEPHVGLQSLLWKIVPYDDQSRGLHGREIVDGTTGVRLAWAFCRRRHGYLDLEEFVVWPNDRRRGYGRALAELVHELAAAMGLPLRAWVPYADARQPELLAVAMRLLGLHLHSPIDRCASYIALSESSIDPALAFLPPRASAVRDYLEPNAAIVFGESTDSPPAEHPASTVYQVWFGTNRLPIKKTGGGKSFGPNRDQMVHYGTVDVCIPKSHQFGSVGSRWWQRWLQGTDDRLTVRSVDELSDTAFWETLRERIKVDEGDSVVFIHGYNVDFAEAAIRAAQIGFDLKVPGQMAFFSWPSRGKVSGYGADEASIESSKDAITEFLSNFAQATGHGRLHVIAHSMGSRGLTWAVESICKSAQTAAGRSFGQLILAAPDLDAGVFRNAAAYFQQAAGRTTLYASSGDWPLWFSKKFHDYPRAGKTPPVTIAPGVDTVVVPNFDLFTLGHGYFAEAEPLLRDMNEVIRHNTQPSHRQRLQPELVGSEAYWIIR